MKLLATHIKDVLLSKTSMSKKRSKDWPKVRAAHLKANPNCSLCGGTSKVEVHHIVPFHEDRSLELDPKNLVTLCEAKKYGLACHLFAGHLGDYRNANPSVMDDIEVLKALLLKKSGS